MHVLEWIQTRPSINVEWLAHEKLDQLSDARSEFPGFLGKGVFFSKDKLTRTVITKWDSSDSSEQFFLTFETLIEECNLMTSQYNRKHGIVLSRVARSE